MVKLTSSNCLTFIFVCLTSTCLSQQLASRMQKQSGIYDRSKVSTPPAGYGIPLFGGVAAPAPGFVAPNDPTISRFQPTAAGIGQVVAIFGTDFDNSTTVSFGGVAAVKVTLRSNTRIDATVGAGQSGPIILTNAHGSGSIQGFTLVPPPTITSVTHAKAGSGMTITITGTNFIGYSNVSINNLPSVSGLIISPTTVLLTISTSSILTSIEVGTPGGVVDYPSTQAATGNVDLNLPDFGNGLTLIPTPSFDYSQVFNGKNTAFSERIWGNSLGIDSSQQKLGAKFLLPQTSIFGLKGEGDVRFTDAGSSVLLSGAIEINVLVKKVSFFDTAAKTNTNFNPFVIHPRLALVSSFAQGNVFIGAYCNFLTVVGSNDQFASFFNTHSKNVFVYPEIDFGGLINMGSAGNQAIKLELDMIVNNGDAQFMTRSSDVLIPALKIGFVTAL
jgi:IPT/TIG domain